MEYGTPALAHECEIDQYFADQHRKHKPPRVGRGAYFGGMIGLEVASGLMSRLAANAEQAGVLFVLLIIIATYIGGGLLCAARARDAGRNIAGWTTVALIVPFAWIVLGCFRTADDSKLLRKIFE